MRDAGRCKLVGLYALACWVIATGACGLDWTVPEPMDEPATIGAGGQAATGGGTGAPANEAGGSDSGGAGGGSSASTSGASSGGGAGSMCDVDTCAACDECAVAKDCAALLQACDEDPPCSPLAPSCCAEVDACVYGDAETWQCAGNLADSECIDACYAWVYYPPESIELHRQLMQCILCDTCPTTCAGFQQGDWLGGC